MVRFGIFFAVLALAVLCLYGAYSLLNSAEHGSSDDELKASAILQGISDAINKEVPLVVDEVTSLIATQADGLKITYIYELEKGREYNFGAAELAMRKFMCDDISNKKLIDMGVSATYRYLQNGQIIHSYDIQNCA